MGKADIKDASNVRTLDEFYKRDNNDVYDDTGLICVEKIRNLAKIHKNG